MDFVLRFDVLMLPWIFVLNILGQYLKKHRPPDWIAPLPVLLWFAGLVICSVGGWFRYGQEYASVVRYALTNGTAITTVAICGYETVTGYLGRWLTSVKGIIARIKARKEAD